MHHFIWVSIFVTKICCFDLDSFEYYLKSHEKDIFGV